MSGDYLVAFWLSVAVGAVGGASVPWSRFEITRWTPAAIRALVLSAVSAGWFLVISGITGLFYFLGGPTSPYAILFFAAIGTLAVMSILGPARWSK